jgi:hypothetical protein
MVSAVPAMDCFASLAMTGMELVGNRVVLPWPDCETASHESDRKKY